MMGSIFSKYKNTTTMANGSINDSELNSEIDYEFPNYIPLKAKVCVVCASNLPTDVSKPGPSTSLNDDDGDSDSNDRTHVPRFQTQVPICADRFLKGISVFCEALNIDKNYTGYGQWAIGGGAENFVQHVCCRSCYSRFGQLVTLQELIVATQASLREDVAAIQQCIVQSQDKDVEFSLNTCHKFREDVIQNFVATTHAAEAPEYLLSSNVEDEVGNIASDVESEGDYYADAIFFENVARNQEPVSKPKRIRPPKNKLVLASNTVDEVLTHVGQQGLPLTPNDSVDVSSTVEDEGDPDPSPIPFVIVSISSLDQGQNRATPKPVEASDSEPSYPVVKRNRGRPRKSEPPTSLSQTTRENREPVQGCSSSLFNERTAKRGRPRKNESIGPGFLTTPPRSSSCLPINDRSQHSPRLNESVESLLNTTQEVSRVEGPVFSFNGEGIKRSRGRPRKNESIGPHFLNTPARSSSCLSINEIRSQQSPRLNASVDSLSNTTQEVYHEEGAAKSHNESIVQRQRGRPRKSEYNDLRSQTTPKDNFTPVQGSSGLPGNDRRHQHSPELNESVDSLLNTTQEVSRAEGPLFSSSDESIVKRSRGRPRKNESVGPRSQMTPENLSVVLGSSFLSDNERSSLEHPQLNESFNSLSNTTQEVYHEEGATESHNESIAQRQRGRPRKSEFNDLRSQTTPKENVTPVQGSSCLPGNERSIKRRRETISPNNESSAKQSRGRPRKSEFNDLRSQTTPKENFTAVQVQGSSGLPGNERSIKRRRETISPNNEKSVKRKRGRPPKERFSLDSDTPRTVAAKRGRGRPKKDDNTRLNSGRGNLSRDKDEKSVNFLNEDILIDKSKHRVKKNARKLLNRARHPPNSKSKFNVIKRPPGRPRKYDRNVMSEGTRRHAIYVLNYLGSHSQRLMFRNVMFLKEATTLHCGHPDCNHSISNTGYFTDQAAYYSMQLHIKNIHRNKYHLTGQKRQKYYYCCHCEIQLKGLNDLLKHKRTEHPGEIEPLAMCEVCGDVMHYQLLSKHLISHKNEDERSLVQSSPKSDKCGSPVGASIDVTSKFSPVHRCSQCDKGFRWKSQCQIHEASHIPVELRKNFICDICGARVSSACSLKFHEKNVHSSTPIQCEYCPKWYKNVKHLKRHHAKHHSEFLPQKPVKLVLKAQRN